MPYNSILTNGLVPDTSQGQGSSTISQGLPNLAAPAPAANTSNIPSTTDGVTVNATSYNPYIDLDPGITPDSIPLIPTPTYTPSNFGVAETNPANGYVSYAGTNIQALIEIANPNGSSRFAKEFIELTAISISIHRAKTAASACGFIGAKGYAHGRRSIAGTMILTQFTQDVLNEFLNPALVTDLSKDSTYVKVDQLPLFNLTLLFTSELGYMSYRRLYGIDFVTDGTVYAVNDLMTEQTISYVASDFTPLVQLGQNPNWQALQSNPLVTSETTPGQVMAAQNQVSSSN